MNKDLIHQSIFGDNQQKKAARLEIRRLAKEQDVVLSSINNLYQSIGRGETKDFVVPAFNLRTLTYDTARIIFRLAKKQEIFPFIFELAPGEQTYTDQTPDEYTTCVLAAALAENYSGPVYLQGDHYQVNAKRFGENRALEIRRLEELIKTSIEAGFYNIDIDASTLASLEENYKVTALLTKYIREIQPKDITVSVGGEIGHIGGKNTTVEEFEAFMNGFMKEILNSKSEITNKSKIQSSKLSKISIQTGTSHGGVMAKDGKMVRAKIDFDLIEKIGKMAREKYGLAGVVQHGASTLSDEIFYRFVEVGCLEVHLATGFQNIICNFLPRDLKEKMDQWVKNNCQAERKTDENDEQFIYRLRKKALGPFKKDLWSMNDSDKKLILEALEKKFLFYFQAFKLIRLR